MAKKGKHRLTLLAALLFVAVATSTGFEPKGPAQQAGENIDKGIQNSKDTSNPPGPAEKAGRGLDKALGKRYGDRTPGGAPAED